MAILTDLSAAGQVDSNDPKKLKVALYEGCPFICLDGTGIFLEVLYLALEGTGYQVELVKMPFERAKLEMEKGKIDILPGILHGGVRNALFPDTWLYYTETCFFVRPGDNWIFDGVQSTLNRRLLLEKGIIHSPAFFKSLAENKNVTYIYGTNILERQLKLLARDRGDTFTSEMLVLVHHLRATGKQLGRDVVNAGCFGRDYEFLAISTRRSDAAELRDTLSQRLRSIRETEAYRDIEKKYKNE
jgi:hypothetical protein